MNKPNLFVYEPRKQLVSADQAAELVQDGASCHDFRINHRHELPDLHVLERMLTELRFSPSDGDSYLMLQVLTESMDAAKKGSYGIAAVLSKIRGSAITTIEKAQNARGQDGENPYFDHAEMRLIHRATPYLIQHQGSTEDVLAVNLCPCPACLGHMISAKFRNVLIGTIDPEVGAAFLRGRDLKHAVSAPRARRVEEEGYRFRFPDIVDSQTKELLLRLSWEIFHTSKKTAPYYKK